MKFVAEAQKTATWMILSIVKHLDDRMPRIAEVFVKRSWFSL